MRKAALDPCNRATAIQPPASRKAALLRRAPKPVGISGAPGKRARVLESGTTVPLSSWRRRLATHGPERSVWPKWAVSDRVAPVQNLICAHAGGGAFRDCTGCLRPNWNPNILPSMVTDIRDDFAAARRMNGPAQGSPNARPDG
jgi:hypothetical protein